MVSSENAVAKLKLSNRLEPTEMSNSCALTVFGILIGLGASAQAGPIDDCISGQVARRILVCTEAIQDDHLDDRQMAEAYDSRGTGYFAQGKLPEAISDFDQAARLKPDQASFRIHKGDASIAAGQLDQAIGEYNQAIQLAPGSSDGFIGRGTVRLHQQKLEEALADFDEAVRLNPNSLLAYNNRGDAHFSLGQFDFGHCRLQSCYRSGPQRVSSLLQPLQCIQRQVRFGAS